MTLLIMTLLIMTLLITVYKKNMCNVTFINVVSKVVTSTVFISIVVVSIMLSARGADFCTIFLHLFKTHLHDRLWRPILTFSAIWTGIILLKSFSTAISKGNNSFFAISNLKTQKRTTEIGRVNEAQGFRSSLHCFHFLKVRLRYGKKGAKLVRFLRTEKNISHF